MYLLIYHKNQLNVQVNIPYMYHPVPTKTQLSNFLGTPGEDYFKGNPKSLNFYFLVIWWGKHPMGYKMMTINIEVRIFSKNGRMYAGPP